MGGISEEAIRERAYQIWVREGCPHGRDFDHWVQAQVELTAESIASNGGAKRVAAVKRPRAAAAPKPVPAAKPARNAAPRAARVKKR